MLSLGAIPWTLARRDPHLVAVQVDGRSLTAAQLDAAASGVAAALTRRGVAAGRLVAVLCPNSLVFPAAYFGALRLGAVVAPLSTASPAPELASSLRALHAAAVVADATLAAAASAALRLAGCDAPLVVIDEDAARGHGDRLALTTLVACSSTDPVPVPGEAPAVVIGTSGTTGLPKRAVHSHTGLMVNARAVAAEMLGLTPDDRQLCWLPLAHSFGMSAVLNASLVAGCGVVLMPGFDAVAALRLMAEQRITVVQGVPTAFARLARARAACAPSAGPIPVLRRLVVSGAPLPPGLAAEVHAHVCTDVVERWGMTECSPLTMRSVPAGGGEPGDVGRPLWGVCVRVAGDPGPGVAGELEATAPTLFRGYLNDRRATAAAVVGGFMRTGDLGAVGADGTVRLQGRLKDVIVRGGNNVAALEVEHALASHPGVREAAVLGVRHADLGEEVAAVVVLDPRRPPDDADLAAHCRALLSGYKVPRLWARAAELPRTSTGKVRKGELRDLFEPG